MDLECIQHRFRHLFLEQVFMNATQLVFVICLPGMSMAACTALKADDASRQASAHAIAAEMTDIFDLVLERHVLPVTKQQMVHYCLTMAYQRSGRVMPGRLAMEKPP